MIAPRWYYVCDACGSFVTITDAPIPEGVDWVCDDRGSDSAWEFTNEANALQHSRHIQRLANSGLLRRSS